MALRTVNTVKDLFEPKKQAWFVQTQDIPSAFGKKISQQRMFNILQFIIMAQEIAVCPIPVENLDNEQILERAEAMIRLLVENGNIGKAKNELARFPEGASPALDKWKRFFADPVIMRGGPASGKNFRIDFEWVEQNSEVYKGQWIAILDGKLLGSNQSRFSLQQELKERNVLEGATFFKVEE